MINWNNANDKKPKQQTLVLGFDGDMEMTHYAFYERGKWYADRYDSITQTYKCLPTRITHWTELNHPQL